MHYTLNHTPHTKPHTTHHTPGCHRRIQRHYIRLDTTHYTLNHTPHTTHQGVTEGYNGTIFAYGQTGCGKSFTMQGIPIPETQRGIIPRFMSFLIIVYWLFHLLILFTYICILYTIHCCDYIYSFSQKVYYLVNWYYYLYSCSYTHSSYFVSLIFVKVPLNIYYFFC